MPDGEVAVRIVADASGVKPGVDVAKGSIEGLAPMLQQLNASFAGLSDQIKASMSAGAASTKELGGALHSVGTAAEEASFGFTGLIAKVHEGAESVRTFQMRAKEFAEVYVAMFAVDRIAEFSKSMGEAAEKVQHLSQTFGMSVTQVQQLQGVTAATGISVDALTRGMGIFDKNMVTATEGSSALANAFKAVGVSANDGATQMQNLETVADKFKDMDDGPKKVALAMELFGRSGKELIPVLNMGAEGIAELVQRMQDYGVENDGAVEKGFALAESWNTNKLAMMGVSNVLADSLAPLMTQIVNETNDMTRAFVQSYNAGGQVKTIMQDIVDSARLLIETIVTLGADIYFTFETINGAAWAMAGVIAGVINTIIDSISTLLVALRALEKVFEDVFTLNWSAIASDFKDGFAQIAQSAKEGGEQVANNFKEGFDKGKAAWGKGDAAEAGASSLTQSMDARSHRDNIGDNSLNLPSLGGLPKGSNGGDFDPDLGTTPKQKKPKDDIVQNLEEELEAKKLAWSMEQDAQGTAQQYSLDSEASYWKDALSLNDLSAKDRLAIEQKYLAAHGQLTKQAIQIELDGYKQQIAAAGNNMSAKLQIAQAEATEIGRLYGTESKEYADAQAAIVKIKQQAAEQLRQIDTEISQNEAKLALAGITAEETAAKFRVSMGVQTNAQLIAQEQQFENQRFAIQSQALQRQKTLIDPNRDPVQYQKINGQIEQLDQQHQAKLTQLEQQAILQRTAIERAGINSVSSSWGQAIGKMITLQASFASTIKSLWQGLQQAIGNAISTIITNWLTQQISALLIGDTASKASGVAQISTQAAIAGAGGVASMAAAPWPLDMGAPAFGASMAAAAGSFASLLSVPSAAGGWGDVSSDGLAMIHQREMVLPANLASPLRSMLTNGGAANNNAPMAANNGGGGDVHYHDHTGTMTPDQIIANRAAVVAAIKMAKKEGRFSGL